MRKDGRVLRAVVSKRVPVQSALYPVVDAKRAEGFLGGTKLLTPFGNVDVADLKPGAQVETFDRGMTEVRLVVQQRVWSNRRARSLEHWPVLVPEGVLGNDTAIRLMQNQVVLLECDLVESGVGDPFMLVPLRALQGFQGITPVRPEAEQILYHLVFDAPEIVAVANGAYVLNDMVQSLAVTEGRLNRVRNLKAMSEEKTNRFMDFLEQGGCDHCEAIACGRQDCADKKKSVFR